MENTYLIDTNVILDYMANRLPAKSADKLDKIIDSDFYISIINKIELLGFRDISAVHEKSIQRLISLSRIFHLDDSESFKSI